MINGKKVLAIVTARGGSKGLIGKNTKPLLGKPLIAWTIEPALNSRYIDKLIVSTDDEEIAEISKKLGAEVPFKRSEELSTDFAKSIDVILHAIKFFQSVNEHYDLVFVLQPTSPLRTTEDIDSALEYYISKNADSVISVCEIDHHPAFSNTLPDDNLMTGFMRNEFINKNRFDLPRFYRMNGAIYIASTDLIISNKSFMGYKTYAFIMPKQRSVDINDEVDFMLAETILKQERK